MVCTLVALVAVMAPSAQAQRAGRFNLQFADRPVQCRAPYPRPQQRWRWDADLWRALVAHRHVLNVQRADGQGPVLPQGPGAGLVHAPAQMLGAHVQPVLLPAQFGDLAAVSQATTGAIHRQRGRCPGLGQRQGARQRSVLASPVPQAHATRAQRADQQREVAPQAPATPGAACRWRGVGGVGAGAHGIRRQSPPAGASASGAG